MENFGDRFRARLQSSPVTRFVLDTNIWLDWLIFDDPSVGPLKSAQAVSQAEFVINSACLDELGRVLEYPEFALDAATRATYLTQVAGCTLWHQGSSATQRQKLPRCGDPDDQKFLELARDAKADWLITKDKTLLALRRSRFRLPFRIATPEQLAAKSHAAFLESARTDKINDFKQTS